MVNSEHTSELNAGTVRRAPALPVAAVAALLAAGVLGSALSVGSAPAAAQVWDGRSADSAMITAGGDLDGGRWERWRERRRPGLPAASGSECLIGGSAVASGCVVTSQQPVLQIPGTGSGNVYIVDGTSPDQNNAWVSPSINLSPSGACGGNTCYTVPATAGLLPRHSYQWTFVPSGGGDDLSWQGFTIDYVRAGREPTDSFGPLTIGLASGTVQTASGTVQIGLAHRGGR